MYALISFALTLRRMFTGLLHAFKEPNFRTLFVITLIMLLSGTMFYHGTEKFSYIDAIYFSVMTLTTVGTPDLTPHTTFGKLFTMVYTFAGVGVILGVIYYVARGIHFSSKRPSKNDTQQLDAEEDVEGR